MKIAYINLVYSKDNMLGVEKKLLQEALFFEQQGIDVYFLNRHDDGYKEHMYFIKVDDYHSSYFFELYLRAFTFKVIEKCVNLDSYDTIYLRYPLMDLSALGFAKRYGYKIITQHHGKELEEISRYKIALPFKIFQYLSERFIAPRFFKYIKGLTAISNDLISYEQNRLGFKNKTMHFSNGIDASKFSMYKPPMIEDSFRLLIMASSYAPWHGLDRLLKSLALYEGAIMIEFYIVGQVSSEYDTFLKECDKNPHVKVSLLGKIYGEKLDNVFKKTHMACDSLGMFHLKMQEASTLKSKEYIARGIPFLYSAPDLDLEEVMPYLYNVKNEDSLIDFEKILKFYKKLDIVQVQKIMKKTTKNTLAWDKKIKDLKESMFC